MDNEIKLLVSLIHFGLVTIAYVGFTVIYLEKGNFTMNQLKRLIFWALIIITMS